MEVKTIHQVQKKTVEAIKEMLVAQIEIGRKSSFLIDFFSGFTTFFSWWSKKFRRIDFFETKGAVYTD